MQVSQWIIYKVIVAGEVAHRYRAMSTCLNNTLGRYSADVRGGAGQPYIISISSLLIDPWAWGSRDQSFRPIPPYSIRYFLL